MTNGDGATLAQMGEAAVKVAPPLGVTGTLFLGLPLNEWLIILTIIYTVLQIGFLLKGQIATLIKKEPTDGSKGK